MPWYEINFILKNEMNFRKKIEYRLLEGNRVFNSEVQNNIHGNAKERSLIDFMEDREYKRAVKYIKTIDKTKSRLNSLQMSIYTDYFLLHEKIEYLGIKYHYSSSSIKKILSKIRSIFLEEFHLL